MKKSVRAIACSLLVALPLIRTVAAANLVIDGTFTSVVNTGTNTYTFGQFGNNSLAGNGGASGAVLTVMGWDTAGYNFVYAPGTADSGTGTNGANANQPHEAPGQFSVGGYGNTYLFGAGGGTNPGNGGLLALPPSPAGGNFIAADGAYETQPITQTINSLVIGSLYAVSFYWGGAQQEGVNFTSATTDAWKVSLGSDSFTTSSVNVPNKGFSGWQQQRFVFKASATSEVLSFLATGTPTGQPPFSLLSGVSLDLVPEPSTWTFLVGLAGAGVGIETMRRRRQKLVSQAD